MTILFKDGDRMGIRTDCRSADSFKDEFALAISGLVEAGNFEGDWEFQLQGWLPQFAYLMATIALGVWGVRDENGFLSCGSTEPADETVSVSGGMVFWPLQTLLEGK